MAVTSAYLYPDAATAHSLASSFTMVDVPIQVAIQTAIKTAIAAGLLTATIGLSSYTPLQIQTQMNSLELLGYIVSYSGSTLTVSF